MSNNSVVALDADGVAYEIGRAQGMQARGGPGPSVRFNPVLLCRAVTAPHNWWCGAILWAPSAPATTSSTATGSRASSPRTCRAAGRIRRGALRGAGSPAEINLRATDLANMGPARAANIPVVVVGDIDRGGVLAHLFGTVAVLAPEDQALIAGFIINKVPRDPALLAPGLDQLAALTGRPTYGWFPTATSCGSTPRIRCRCRPARSSACPPSPGTAVAARRRDPAAPHLQLHRYRGSGLRARGAGPLGHRPGRHRRRRRRRHPGHQGHRRRPGLAARAGLADAIAAHVGSGRVVLGICGGFQMLCERIDDTVESRTGAVAGLGLLDADIAFAPTRSCAAGRPR